MGLLAPSPRKFFEKNLTKNFLLDYIYSSTFKHYLVLNSLKPVSLHKTVKKQIHYAQYAPKNFGKNVYCDKRLFVI